MSTGDLKSIDKLRDTAFSYAPNIRRQVNMACDEIEQEIAERYIELPVDADGVPIHPGNCVEMDGKGGEVWLVGTTDVMCNDGMSYRSVAVNHVKPRTIEDVLEEFAWGECGLNLSGEPIAKYAEEIRRMMA